MDGLDKPGHDGSGSETQPERGHPTAIAIRAHLFVGSAMPPTWRQGVKRGFPTVLPGDLDGRRGIVGILTRLSSISVFVNIVNQDDRSFGL